MQNIQTKEDAKQAAHRLQRKMKSLVPGASLSQAQEALASVFGTRNFDTLIAALPFADERRLPQELGVHWVRFENGRECADGIPDFCDTVAAFKESLLHFALYIEKNLMGETYKLFRDRFSEDDGWVRDDAEPVAVYEDCKLVGGSMRDWLAKARVRALKDSGLAGAAGETTCSIIRFSQGRSAHLIGVYKETTIAGGFDHYILRDEATGKNITLPEGNFLRYPDFRIVKKTLEKVGYLAPEKA